MSINARGSRTLKIGDREYAWRIRRQGTYDQERFAAPMTLAIQRTMPFARGVLVVDLGVSRPDNLVAPHQTAVTPAIVRAIIDRALEDGWQPESGRGHSLRFPLIRDQA